MSEVLPHGPTPADPMEFRRLSPLTPIAKSGIWLVAAIFAVGRDAFNDKRGLSAAPFIAGGIVLLGLLTGFASWWRTRFRITNDELRIDTGLISQQSRRVRLDRIVGIDVNQPFI
ncbi:MAG TPA: PH domain-containing protein, partial [Marmoricola sp.]|nr:PH domain-containing protein [Marmoricola sp.]